MTQCQSIFWLIFQLLPQSSSHLLPDAWGLAKIDPGYEQEGYICFKPAFSEPTRFSDGGDRMPSWTDRLIHRSWQKNWPAALPLWSRFPDLTQKLNSLEIQVSSFFWVLTKNPLHLLIGVGGLKTNYIFSPFLMRTTLEVFSNLKVQATVWFSGRVSQYHICFFGSAATFVDIAPDASGDNVFPAITTTARTGNHMIEG